MLVKDHLYRHVRGLVFTGEIRSHPHLGTLVFCVHRWTGKHQEPLGSDMLHEVWNRWVTLDLLACNELGPRVNHWKIGTTYTCSPLVTCRLRAVT
jgi:hypothetical protein